MGKDGYSRESLWGDHTNHYDASGRKIGESRESLWGDHTNTYDASGRKTGESRDSLWGDHTNHYDSSGRKTGESRDSLWGDHTNHYGSWHPGGTSSGLDSPYASPSAADGDPYLDPAYPVGSGSTGPFFTRPASRLGLFGQGILLLLGGIVGSALIVLLGVFLIAILKQVPGIQSLVDAVAFHGAFGILLPVSWAVMVCVAIVVGQLLFTDEGEMYITLGKSGLAAGTAALIGFGMAGWIDGWGGVLPSLAAFAGFFLGATIDFFRGTAGPADGDSAARRSRRPVLLTLALCFTLAAGVAVHQGWSAIAEGKPSSGATTGADAPLRAENWVLVLASLPKKSTSRQEAEAAAKKISKKRRAVVVDTQKYAGLTDGYWAVVDARPFKTEKSARSACSDFDRSPGKTCYPRQLK